MSGFEIQGVSAQGRVDVAPRPAPPAATATETAQAVQQVSRSAKTQTPRHRQEGNQEMMLQSQSLSTAIQEELRLQQKLADLRENIEATEDRLRRMQAQEQQVEKARE